MLDVVERRARLPVVVARLPREVAGACHQGPEGALLWVNGAQFRPRQRFTLAHELAHAWCRHDGHRTVDSIATLSGTTTSPLEIQANAFAAEFLVPRAAMRQLVAGEPSLDEVVTIAAAFGVSAIVVLYRLKELRLASPARIAQLQAEIDERLHEDAFARLGLTPARGPPRGAGAPALPLARAGRDAPGGRPARRRRGGRRPGRRRAAAADVAIAAPAGGRAGSGVRAAGEQPVELVELRRRRAERRGAQRLDVLGDPALGVAAGAEQGPPPAAGRRAPPSRPASASVAPPAPSRSPSAPSSRRETREGSSPPRLEALQVVGGALLVARPQAEALDEAGRELADRQPGPGAQAGDDRRPQAGVLPDGGQDVPTPGSARIASRAAPL